MRKWHTRVFRFPHPNSNPNTSRTTYSQVTSVALIPGAEEGKERKANDHLVIVGDCLSADVLLLSCILRPFPYTISGPRNRSHMDDAGVGEGGDVTAVGGEAGVGDVAASIWEWG